MFIKQKSKKSKMNKGRGLELNNTNFSEKINTQGKRVLGINLRGPVLVWFGTSDCRHCKAFAPHYQTLLNDPEFKNNQYRRPIVITKIDLQEPQNESVGKLSMTTTTPMKSVPVFLFYYDGIPLYKFSGSSFTAEQIKNFVFTSLDKVLQTQSSSGSSLGTPVSYSSQQQAPIEEFIPYPMPHQQPQNYGPPQMNPYSTPQQQFMPQTQSHLVRGGGYPQGPLPSTLPKQPVSTMQHPAQLYPNPPPSNVSQHERLNQSTSGYGDENSKLLCPDCFIPYNKK
jgi:thiol-disulfide isomerase/thioredoxin